MDGVKEWMNLVVVLGLLVFAWLLLRTAGATGEVLQLVGVIVGGILGYLQGQGKEKNRKEGE